MEQQNLLNTRSEEKSPEDTQSKVDKRDFILWNSKQIINWIKEKNIKLDEESERKWINNGYSGEKLKDLNHEILKNDFSINSIIQRIIFLKAIHGVFSEEKQENLSFIQQVPYQQWNPQQVIIWLNCCLKDQKLDEKQIKFIKSYIETNGQKLDSLTNILQKEYQIDQDQQISIILQSLEELKQKVNQDNQNNQNLQQFVSNIDNKDIQSQNNQNQNSNQNNQSSIKYPNKDEVQSILENSSQKHDLENNKQNSNSILTQNLVSAMQDILPQNNQSFNNNIINQDQRNSNNSLAQNFLSNQILQNNFENQISQQEFPSLPITEKNQGLNDSTTNQLSQYNQDINKGTQEQQNQKFQQQNKVDGNKKVNQKEEDQKKMNAQKLKEEEEERIKRYEQIRKQQENLSFTDFFLNEKQRNEYRENCKNNEKTFTFYCYFSQFQKGDLLRLIIYQNKICQKYRSLEVSKEEYMIRIPNTKIFYLHINLENHDLSYNYLLDRHQYGKYSYCQGIPSILIQRDQNDLNSIQRVIFDTPNQFGSYSDGSKTMLQSYTKLYAQNCEIISGQFLQHLYQFIKYAVNQTKEQKNLLILFQQNEDFEKLSLLKIIIYIGALQSFGILEYYQAKLNYNIYINIEEIKQEYQNFLTLSEDIKIIFGLGLKVLIKKQQLIEVLKLPKEMRKSLPDVMWDLQINNVPEDQIIEQIEFNQVDLVIRDKIYQQIYKLFGLTLNKNLYYIKILNPSVKYQIESINNYLQDQKYKEGNSSNQDLIDFFGAQPIQIQQQIILNEVIRSSILQNEYFIDICFDILTQDTVNEVQEIQLKDKEKIIRDIFESFKRQSQVVFKNQFANLIKTLNNERFCDQSNLNNLKNLIIQQGYQECYELILQINLDLKSRDLEATLIQSVAILLKQAKLEKDQQCQRFQEIVNTNFFKILNQSSQAELLLQLFDVSFSHHLPQNEINLKLIEDDFFRKCLIILTQFNLIQRCLLPNQILQKVNQLMANFKQNQIKISELRQLLQVNNQKLLDFLEVVNLKLEDSSLELALKQIDLYDKYMIGLKQLAHFMEDLNIQNHQQMDAQVKNYFETNQNMYFEEFTTKFQNEKQYSCLEFLYQFNHISIVYNYIKSSLVSLNQQAKIQNDDELDKKIIVLISEINSHLNKINNYKQQNDSLTLKEVLRFWKYTFKGTTQNKEQIFKFINKLQVYFNTITQQQSHSIQLNNEFIQDIITTSQFYQNKDVIQQVQKIFDIIGYSNKKFIKDEQNLKKLALKIEDIMNSASKEEQNFSEFATLIYQDFDQILKFLPDNCKNDIQNLISVVKNTKSIIDYLNTLDREKIQLEDLVDVIDDTSMETDVLVQEMMNVRNSLQIIRFGEEDKENLMSCLASRFQKYELNLKNNYKLEATINRCMDNLEDIKAKIQSYKDKSTQILQNIKNIEKSIKVLIERKEGQSESLISFITTKEQNQKGIDLIFNYEDFNLLCNRYQLIKSNKKNNQQQQQDQQQIDNSKEIIYNNLNQVLQLSQQIKLTLDNLKNLGYTQLQGGQYSQKNSLELIIPQLQEELQKLQEKNETHVNDLYFARQKYISLNFYPPSSFDLILKLKSCINKQNESKHYLNQLRKLTMFINEHQKPNLDDLKMFLANQNEIDGMDLYGQALDVLLNLPKIDYVENISEQLEKLKFTQGNQLECRRIKSYDLLLKSIITIFLAHKQKPTSWQIFFCSPQTHILDLEQFAYLAKNFPKHQVYQANNPLFLICQFEKLPITVQRQFIDKLTQMYEQKDLINLLITYVGNLDEESSMHILQQFKYVFEVDSKLKNDDLVQYAKIQSFNNISVHLSKYSGFGKSFQIYKRCKQNKQELIEIPIYGETTKFEIIRLIQKKFSVLENPYSSKFRLHLNLYDLKSDEIHCILFQLLILRKLSISSSYFAQIPNQMDIDIEIQNTFLDVFEKKIQYLKEYIPSTNIFKYDLKTIMIQKPYPKSIKGADLDNFEVENNPNFKYEEFQISFQYLKNYSQIRTFEIKHSDENEKQKFIQYLQKNEINQKEAIDLIKEYFLHQVQENFSFYHIICILKFFCKQVVLFHQACYLRIDELDFQGIDNSLREKVFQGIINASVSYSCQIMSNNFLTEQQEKNVQNLLYFETLEQRNKNMKRWDDTVGKQNEFFLTISQSGNLLPIFQKIESVPKYYLNYCKMIKDQVKDWSNLDLIEKVLINLCTPDKNRDKVKADLQKNYSDIAITKSVARKICFLYIKINSNIPTLIMGETGVGKTIIVKYLSHLIKSPVFTLDVHAGLTQNEIIQWVDTLIQLSQLDAEQCSAKNVNLDQRLQIDPENENLKYEKALVNQFHEFKVNQKIDGYHENKVILFFDEINTNQNIDGILKELLVEKKIQGEPLPDYFVPIAAANPYKFKTEKDQQENANSLKISSCDNNQTSKLVYHVFPLAESMNTFIWQFGELLPEDEKKIVTQMVKNASKENQYIAKFQTTLIETITGCQDFSRKKQSVRSVSLRDVSRFLKVFKYFKTDPAWNQELQDSLLLSVFFGYYCRFNDLKLRDELCSYLEQTQKVTYQEGRKSFQYNVKSIVNEQMNEISGILEQGEFFKSIAFTTTLKENLFMILISVLNNIPIIMVGPPGSSKTLCTRLLYNSMKGSKSSIKFFKKLPNLIYKTYQCSTLSTSDGIEKTFKQAKQLDNAIQKSIDGAKTIVALILDEIGLAEASKSNPLKVLHRLLEYQQNVPMIGLSNWQLDASKMNRVVFSNRPKLSEEELVEAAIALRDKIYPNSELCLNILVNLAKDSFNYFSQDQYKTFFHGTRDFYNCAIYICYQLKNCDEQRHESIEKIILKGILRNFGGQKDVSETLDYFKLSLRQNVKQQYDNNLNQFNPTELIQMNINDKNCRNLMIIANKPDHALQYTEKLCQNRLYKIFQGSDLQDDFTEYNTLKMLNEIITCMEEGYLVIMYSLESLYQSFYDLFNQNYVELGERNFCRIAIGSDSIRSQVHPNFKVIIIASSIDVYDQRQNYDPPLLNRFEKQYLELKFLLKDNEIFIKKELTQFIQDCSDIKSDRRLRLNKVEWRFGIQDMFPIIQNENKEDILFSLTLKNNDETDQIKRIEKSQYDLIDLANFSGIIRSYYLKKIDPKFYNYYLNSMNHKSFSSIIDKLNNQKKNEQNKLAMKQNKNESYYGENNNFNDYECYENNNFNDYECYENNNFNDQKLHSLSENLIIYTTEYIYQQDSNYSIQSKNFMELEANGLENIQSLKQQVKQFFSSEILVNLIIISSVQDSITKLLYIKRILQEERQVFDQQQKLENRNKKQKNLIFVIQLINQQTKFIGISYDKFWQQIYIEETSLPMNPYDDIVNYLNPISFVMNNKVNGIYHLALQDSFPKILGNLNFEKCKLSQENLKQRLAQYMKVFQLKLDLDFNQFIINKIIERIESKCQVISEIYGQCEWYQLVSMREKDNRNNNKFISSLKQFIFQESLSILTKTFYVAEKNNIISSLMCKEFSFNENDLNLIFQMWIQKYEELQQEDNFSDQILIIEYPFFNCVRVSIEQFKQTYLEIINEIFQIEERKQKRIEGDHENHKEIAEENNDEINQIEIVNKDKNSRQNIKEIIKLLIKFSSRNDPNLHNISQINPLQYFKHLCYEIEFQQTENKTLQRIVNKIVTVLEGESAIESYHSILWINEQIFTELSLVWNLCEEQNQKNVFETVYMKFEQKVEEILTDHVRQINKEQDLNILEQIWQEMLIFSSNLLQVFIIPNNEDQQDWNQNKNNLQKCLGIIDNCSSKIELIPEQMIQQMSKFNFILKISQCYTKNVDLRFLIKELFEQNIGNDLINFQNYEVILQKFIQQCDKKKENELKLRLIWQLLKCDHFEQDFLEFDDNIMKEIIFSLLNILNQISYDKISKNSQESHYYIFTKRILQVIIQKMFESFDQNKEEEQIENLLEPKLNKSFQKMQKIFEELHIQKTDPICSVVFDIIHEFRYYDSDKILNYIGSKQDDLVDIYEPKVQKMSTFLIRVTQNSSINALVSLIEFKIILEICQSICEFIKEAYNYDKRLEYQDEIFQKSREEIYNSDIIRKNRLIQMLNKTLLIIINQNQQQNPILFIILVKIFKEVYGFQSLDAISHYLEVFKDETIFEKKLTQNILENTLGHFGAQFDEDLKVHKKLTENLKNLFDSFNNNIPQLQFYLTLFISQVIVDKNQNEFDLMIKILNELNLQFLNTYLIVEINKLYLDLLESNRNIPIQLQQVFITNLVMTTFLNDQSLISKIQKGKIDIESTFIPFMVDSDAIFAIQVELLKTTAIRRYQCKNCVKQQKKPYIYTILPCCIPIDNLNQCPNCGIKPRVENNQSPDIEPPQSLLGMQEPIFTKQILDYPKYYYYNIPNFPYHFNVQKIEDFIEQRGRVDPGLQLYFSITQVKQIRNLKEKHQILFGRIFYLSIICFSYHLIKKQKGQDEVNRQLGLNSPSDIFNLIHPAQQIDKQQQQQNSLWDILISATETTPLNLMNYFILKIIKNYLDASLSQNFTDRLNFSEDANRIRFETQFVDEIVEQKELANIKHFTERQLINQQNQNQNRLKEIIMNCKLDLLEEQYLYLQQYKHLLRFNPVINLNSFQRFISLEQSAIQSKFFQKLIQYGEQINILSQIQPIQQFIKLFNLKMFDKITKKESAEITLQQYVQDNFLEKEFNLFRQSWNFIKKLIQNNQIQIGVDCAEILLDDIESEQQKIDILCYSQDQDSRGYPLHLLIQYYQVQHNSFLSQLENEFPQLFNKFQSQRLILMNKKNFIPPNIFSTDNKNKFAQQFFNNFVERFSGHNPYLQHEKQEIYDLNELTVEFIEENYQNVTYIMQSQPTDLEKVQLLNFRFKGDQKVINLVREICMKIDQKVYPDIQNNPNIPLLYIDLQNNEICIKLIDVLKTAMQLILKINSGQKLSGEIDLCQILNDFEIQTQGINFERQKINLCHLLSIYELAERLSFKRLFEDINPSFMLELNQTQKDCLKLFCDQQLNQELDIFQHAIGRMIVRIFCLQSIQINPQLELFQQFQEAQDEYEDFWGLENKTYFQKQIIKSEWNQMFFIFQNRNENAIKLGQTFSMYNEIQKIKDQKSQQEQERINLQLKRQQIDEENILKDLIIENKLVVNQVGKKERTQQINKKSFK